MSLWEFIDKEVEHLKEILHLGKLEERTWKCDPLLVVDDDGNVAYCEIALVDVQPHADGTADLTVCEDRDGWRPSLVKTSVKYFHARSWQKGNGARAGLTCSGVDAEGFGFDWYINGAADDYAIRHLVYPAKNPPAAEEDVPT